MYNLNGVKVRRRRVPDQTVFEGFPRNRKMSSITAHE